MLAIIPARGGSKGVPGKNIKLLCGKPLIAYTIEAAKASQSIDRIVVSTDDPEIAKVAGEYGAEVPFMRPDDLASDDSLAVDAHIYTVERLNRESDQVCEDYIVLQPTVPLRTAEDIDGAVELFQERRADSVISCAEPQQPPEWMLTVNEDGIIEESYESAKKKMANRQQAARSYMPNGAVFVLKHSLVKEARCYYFPNTYAYVMPQERSVDIDTKMDFKFTEFLMKQETVNA